MITFEDSYYYLVITKEVLLTNHISTSGQFGLNLSNRILYFTYHIISVSLYEVLGFKSIYNLLLLTQTIFALLSFIAVIFVLYQFMGIEFSMLGATIFMSIYQVINMQTYDQAQASFVLFFFLFSLLLFLEMGQVSRKRISILSLMIIIALTFSHYATPAIGIFILVIYIFLSEINANVRSLIPKNSVRFQSLLTWTPYRRSRQVYIIIGIVIICQLMVTLYLYHATLLLGIRTLMEIFPFSLEATANESIATSEVNRKISRTGKVTLLNHVPKIDLVFFGGLSIIASASILRHDRRAYNLVIFAIAVTIFSGLSYLADFAKGNALTFLYFSAAGVLAFYIGINTRNNSEKPDISYSFVLYLCLVLILSANILFSAPPSFVNENSDIMQDGYPGVKPIGMELKYSGLWIQNYLTDQKNICTSGRLRGAVTFYGKKPFPCRLSRVHTGKLRNNFILYDQKRLFEPPVTMYRLYDNGRGTIVSE